MAFAFRWTRWGQYVFAIGGNEEASTLTGLPVKQMKVSIYMFSAFTAGVTGILMAGWLGSVTTNLGQSMELAVIAAAVRLRWVRKSGSAIVSAVSSATSAMTGMKEVSRSPTLGRWTATAASAACLGRTGVLTPSP